MAESLTVQMAKILNDYDEQVQNVTNAAIKRVARQTSQMIKNASPRKSGSYAAGWSVKNIGGHGKIVDLVVHNRTDYQLTHLLENGPGREWHVPAAFMTPAVYGAFRQFQRRRHHLQCRKGRIHSLSGSGAASPDGREGFHGCS